MLLIRAWLRELNAGMHRVRRYSQKVLATGARGPWGRVLYRPIILSHLQPGCWAVAGPPEGQGWGVIARGLRSGRAEATPRSWQCLPRPGLVAPNRLSQEHTTRTDRR